MKRSILILNIFTAGGGDYALGKKIKDIARSTQSEGALITVNAKTRYINIQGKEVLNPGKN